MERNLTTLNEQLAQINAYVSFAYLTPRGVFKLKEELIADENLELWGIAIEVGSSVYILRKELGLQCLDKDDFILPGRVRSTPVMTMLSQLREPLISQSFNKAVEILNANNIKADEWGGLLSCKNLGFDVKLDIKTWKSGLIMGISHPDLRNYFRFK